MRKMTTLEIPVHNGSMHHPSYSTLPRSRVGSPILRTKRHSYLTKAQHKERQDFIRKNSPLSSTDLLAGIGKNAAGHSTKELMVFDPTGKRAYQWLFVIGIAVVYFYWTIILRISYSEVQRSWVMWLLADTVFCAAYIADMLVQMRTSYLRDGILEEDENKMKSYYMNTFYFKVDLLSVLPLDWLYLMLTWSAPPPTLHCFKLLKLYRLRQFSNRSETRSRFPNIFRVLFLIHNLLVIIHWNACIYFLVSHWIGLGSDQWVYPKWNTTHNPEWGHFSRQYIYSFYWSTLTLTTIGELPEPQNNFEYAFVTTDYLIGILMFASLVGNVGSIIANTQKSRTKFQNKMDSIKTYMDYTKVPNNLQERVIKWFDYLWTHGHPVDDQHVLDALPDKLKAEIGLHVHFETLKKVNFFEECEPGLLWELVVRLRNQIYSPGEYVCRKGDVGREMYIVNNGRLEVLAEEGGKVLKELSHGDYFGEISVLNLGIGKHQRRRTAFVRSLGYSSLLCLLQNDLLEVLKDYPKAMEVLVEKAMKQLGNDRVSEMQSTVETSGVQQAMSSEDEDKPHLERQESGYLTQEWFLESTGKWSDNSNHDWDNVTRRMSEDSEDMTMYTPPMQLHTVADQLIDVHIRLSEIEDLIKVVLKEVKGSKIKKEPVTQQGTIYTIKERIRKMSSQI